MKRWLITCDTSWCGTETIYSAIANTQEELIDIAEELSYENFNDLGGGFNSVLEEIEGIGPKTIKELLTIFKSVERIKNASLLELTDVIGQSKAKKVKDYFSDEKSTR